MTIPSHRPQYAVNVEQEKCKGKEQVEEELKRVIKLGGEGLMIREPGSKYERRRSHTLLKIKKFYDAEVRVNIIPNLSFFCQSKKCDYQAIA